MRRFALPMFVVLSACALLIALTPALRAGPPPSDVTVINTAGSPVPVTGAVRATLVNGQTPVSRIAILAVGVGERENRQTLYTVPAGKRLIVQSQTAWTIANGDVKPTVTVSGTGGGFFYVVLPQVSRGWFDGQGEIYEGSSAFPLTVDAGQSVEARVWLSTLVPSGGGARVEAGFSGYLVDVP